MPEPRWRPVAAIVAAASLCLVTAASLPSPSSGAPSDVSAGPPPAAAAARAGARDQPEGGDDPGGADHGRALRPLHRAGGPRAGPQRRRDAPERDGRRGADAVPGLLHHRVPAPAPRRRRPGGQLRHRSDAPPLHPLRIGQDRPDVRRRLQPIGARVLAGVQRPHAGDVPEGDRLPRRPGGDVAHDHRPDEHDGGVPLDGPGDVLRLGAGVDAGHAGGAARVARRRALRAVLGALRPRALQPQRVVERQRARAGARPRRPPARRRHPRRAAQRLHR